jgi:hypothetical protein
MPSSYHHHRVRINQLNPSPIARQFAGANAVRGWVKTGRLQHSSKRVAAAKSG